MANAFEAPLARIRAATYYDEDTGREKRYRVHAPATASLRRRITAWANGRLPAELDAFLSLTAGFDGAGVTVNLKQAAVGNTGVLEAYDYGNGDCLGLDDEGDCCAVWWVGHDPYGLIFVAPSLLDYVTRFADVAESGGHAIDDLAMIKPASEIAAVSPADARLRGPSDDLLNIAETARVFDFRGASPRAHFDLAYIPQGFGVKRAGRLVIAEPRNPPSQQEHVAHQVEYLVELAFGLITMEQFDQAREALTKALELDPSSQRARERMELVEARLADRKGT
ncbi:MAG TPA: hypothetical protein VF403_16090 [Kofleriaceae bacterium]